MKGELRSRTYQADTVVQARVDARTLAVLLMVCEAQEIRLQSMSELVRMGLETLAEMYVQTGMIKRVEFTETAQRMLKRQFNKVRVVERKVFHNRLLDELKTVPPLGGRTRHGGGYSLEREMELEGQQDAEAEEAVRAALKELEEKGLQPDGTPTYRAKPASHELAQNSETEDDIVSGRDLDKQAQRLAKEKIPSMTLGKGTFVEGEDEDTEGDTD